MKWKEFLRPTIWKVTIFIVLLILTSVFNYATYCPGCTRAAYGFPLALYELPGCEPVSVGCPGYRVVYSALIVDLIFWYLVSCVILWIFGRTRKKK
jgi:hypothetical protein